MKRILMVLVIITMLGACAPMAQQGGGYDHSRYNTQKGALGGAAAGAIAGQAIGRNTESTLIGLAIGTVFGGLAGNVVDQKNVAAREAARTGEPAVYYDGQGGRVEATPIGPVNQRTDCRKVRKRIWKDGQLVSDTVEEVCEATKTEPHYFNN